MYYKKSRKVSSYSYHALAYLVLCISLYCFVAFLTAVSKTFGGSHLTQVEVFASLT